MSTTKTLAHRTEAVTGSLKKVAGRLPSAQA
jgi:hypothetical protein